MNQPTDTRVIPGYDALTMTSGCMGPIGQFIVVTEPAGPRRLGIQLGYPIVDIDALELPRFK